MIKNIDSLADRLKGVTINGEEITPSKFTELLSSEEEHELSIGEINILTEDELNQAKSNSYKEGAVFGTEKLVKSFKKVNDLDFEGKIKYDDKGLIDFDGLASHITNPLNEKVKSQTSKPSEELKEWQDKYNTLKSTYETEKGQYENKVNELSSTLKNYSIDNKLGSVIPELTGIKKEHAKMIFKSEYQIEDKEGMLIAKKGNEIVKDKLGNPLPINDLFNTFAASNNWLKTPGREGNNEPGASSSKFKSNDEAIRYIKENNIDLFSEEGKAILESVGKE